MHKREAVVLKVFFSLVIVKKKPAAIAAFLYWKTEYEFFFKYFG